MSSEPREYLRHILAEADYLLSQWAGLTFEDFVADETLRRAVVRSLETLAKLPQDGVKLRRAHIREPLFGLPHGAGIALRSVVRRNGCGLADTF